MCAAPSTWPRAEVLVVKVEESVAGEVLKGSPSMVYCYITGGRVNFKGLACGENSCLQMTQIYMPLVAHTAETCV